MSSPRTMTAEREAEIRDIAEHFCTPQLNDVLVELDATRAELEGTIRSLLLSEPEFVDSLPDEVRLSVLTPRERAVMTLGELAMKWDNVYGFSEDERRACIDALAEVRALTPEGKDGD